MKNVTILGATGSVGASALSVLAFHQDQFNVFAVSGHSRMFELAAICIKHAVQFAAVPDDAARTELLSHLKQYAEKNKQVAHPQLRSPILTQVLVGLQALCELAAHENTDILIAAIVGAAGLPSCMAAARSGKTILLANKEALVVSGQWFMQAAAASGATILPLDSEHNALFQCLPQGAGAVTKDIRKVWLTASGGPFLARAIDTFDTITVAEACQHPTWTMGQKISVDSATMMNKGLEVIEAHYLFGLPQSNIGVMIHPQSMVHALVDYVDGTSIAHVSTPDMRVPIAHALAYPKRINSGVTPLDWSRMSQLQFLPPEMTRFPCLALAYQALKDGQGACVALNAANEVAVAAFLAQKLRYLDIPKVVETCLNWQAKQGEISQLDDVFALDTHTRNIASEIIENSGKMR